VKVVRFQPFPSRAGVDTVLGLSFTYDRAVVDTIKQTLGQEKARLGGTQGGWLAEHKLWFVEPATWPAVRRRLAAAGCTFDEETAGTEPVPEPVPEA
jgi:hypothetical protein